MGTILGFCHCCSLYLFFRNAGLQLIKMALCGYDVCSVKHSLTYAWMKTKEEAISVHRDITCMFEDSSCTSFKRRREEVIEWKRESQKKKQSERQEPVLYHLTGDLSGAIRWRRQHDQSLSLMHTPSLSLYASLSPCLLPEHGPAAHW